MLVLVYPSVAVCKDFVYIYIYTSCKYVHMYIHYFVFLFWLDTVPKECITRAPQKNANLGSGED